MNLSRNIGGSVGIALLSTLLSRRTQFHQVQLAAQIGPTSLAHHNFVAGVSHSLVAKGYSSVDAVHHGWGLLWGQTLRQSYLLAMLDVFFVAACICFVAVPLVFIMRRPAKNAEVPSEVH